ncbi:hypothetical protein [Acidimangrovimonas sediminis]|uniref:hypothetical protein n=1 Tax=Acidimangrovimonas sediminis TaxID=2056283 RepID=UPI001304C17E|nr:hypothetical protein [Acidimangrovimonas sediminis]
MVSYADEGDAEFSLLEAPLHGSQTKFLEKPQKVAIRVGHDELPVPALFGTDSIPLILDGEEKVVVAPGKGFDERRDRGYTDLDIQALPKGVAGREVPGVEGAALSNLVDHQLRLPQAEITKPFLHTLIGAFETKEIAIKRLRLSIGTEYWL